ncbi:MAG: bifunctional homocysteine S-methyltransferase/methylenetetrahydrofolate reductase, partial [Candidatus Kapabacteria bacterium]|nr:bifunctional homocysteine S-methyltransferase/methylenetetrahydrofolate reductase [Candidatus Kapabacteria bacterium]
NTRPDFLERLNTTPIVSDGSMSAELQRRGLHESPPDVYNLKNPVVVEEIHRLFLDAGAELLQTNTRHANRFALQEANLADKVYEINRKGVWIARTVALHKAYVAGTVGPTGSMLHPVGSLGFDEVHQAFVEQIVALLDGGADLLLLKSFIDIQELEIAIAAAQFVRSDVPIIALKTFPEDGSVLGTSYPGDIARRLETKNVIALGSNGTVGPQRMVSIIQHIGKRNVPLCAMPDIGIPTVVNGTPVYNAEPDYVAQSARRLVEAGAAIIGADGGATYEHIRAISKAVQGVEIFSSPAELKITTDAGTPEAPNDDRSEFGKSVGKKFLTTVELDIPRGMDMGSVIEGAAYLKQHGIDAVNISDGARARLRMNSTIISKIVQEQTGMECITHVACRDRNMVALQSDMLGAYSLGVKNILAVTGDPAHIGDFPLATSVYDIDAIGLIRSLARMNGGRDLAGNPLGSRTQFTISCACNPAADDLEREIDRLAQKAAEGADVAFSQPIFDMEILHRFRSRTKHLPIKFLVGIIPLRTIRHAEFLHYEVPGMTVPAWVRKRMQQAGASVQHSAQEGMDIAVEFLLQCSAEVDGAYLMPPFKKYDMAVSILQRIPSFTNS